MAEFICPIIILPKVGKHPNAERLSICSIFGSPVIFKSEEFKTGDKVIYIPEEAVLPILPQYAWLWDNRENPSTNKRTVWAKKLRGIFSCGLIISVPEELKDVPVGTDVKDQLGIVKYEPPEEFKPGGENETQQGWFPHYTEIESLRKYNHLLNVGEEVIMCEKLHGCNGRWVYVDEQLWVGSHHNVKKSNGSTTWNIVANKLNLADVLKNYPGMVIFGEVYGNTQKGFQYDSPDISSLRVFDVYSLKDKKYLDYDEMITFVDSLGLKRVPELYRGPWNGIDAHKDLAEGKSILNEKHLREGFVVRPSKERWNYETKRTIFKLVGEGYLLKKGK